MEESRGGGRRPRADAILPAPTVAALLRSRAEEWGSETVYRYLPDGENEEGSLTFETLDSDARAIAAALQRESRRGDRALILAVDSLDFIRAFMACQHAGVIAVPAYPPFPINSEQRVATLCAIARDCGATVVLTSSTELRDAVVDAAPELGKLRWLAVEAVSPEEAEDFEEVPVEPDDISFLQYTSGSTSLPKGVVVTHDALMHNEALIISSFDLRPREVLVGWLPLYHDMGLIGLVLATLSTPLDTILMPPLAFVQRPARWLRAVSRYRASISGGPNFAYELCTKRIPPEERSELDLSSWTRAFNGAEPVRVATLDAFTEAFGPYGFREETWYPCYGLAETTLIATGTEPGTGATRLGVEPEALQEGRIVPGGDHVLVGAGLPNLHRRVEIVDPETCRRTEPGEVGEIWLAGPDVAHEYWGREEESEHTFEARIADSDEGPFLRTGDLGAVHDGELFVAGRLKDIVIVGGRNHYPQDIEATVEAVDASLRAGCSAAFSIEADHDEQVVVVAEVKPSADTDLDKLAASVRASIASEHGIQVDEVMLVPPHSVPKTSSGKVQRSACLGLFERGELTPAQRGELEQVG